MSKEDTAKAQKGLMAKLENEYILTCKRFPVEVNEFVRSQDE